MIAAEPDWLDARGPFDDAARHSALPLLDEAISALGGSCDRSLLVIDIGAGTGNSMRWFDHHLGQRLGMRPVQRVLVDADPQALAIASHRFGPAVRTVEAPIVALPEVAAGLLAESPHPCDLLVTASALLDVLTEEDLAAVVDALDHFGGVGLFLLSISGRWRITPAHRDDDVIHEAFGRHQLRDSRLGAHAASALAAQARSLGARVEASTSSWLLESPRDSQFLTRFLGERVAAAVDVDAGLHSVGRAWLAARSNLLEPRAVTADGDHEGQDVRLRVAVEHNDMLIDASAHRGSSGSENER